MNRGQEMTRQNKTGEDRTGDDRTGNDGTEQEIDFCYVHLIEETLAHLQ